MYLQEVFKVTDANDAIARIIAAKPHSCDVELKDLDWCKMSAETTAAYLNTRINMPPLAEFDVRWMAAKDERERIPVKASGGQRHRIGSKAFLFLESQTMHNDFVCSDNDSDLQS